MANSSLESQNTFSANPSVQRMFGVNPGIDDPSKKEAVEKTEGLIIEAISKLVGIPATAIPIAAVAALLSGIPVPLALLGIAAAAGAGMYLIVENNNLILKKKIADKEREIAERKSGKKVEDPEIKRTPLEIVVNIAKKPFNAARFLIRNISSLGDPEGPGMFNKFLSFLEKRGEGDIPKEWKMVLDGYTTFVNGITFPVKGTLMLWGASTVLAQAVYGRVKVRNKTAEKLDKLIVKDDQDITENTRLEAEKAQQEQEAQLAEQIANFEIESQEFERALDLVSSEEHANGLVQAQKDVLARKSSDLVPNTEADADKKRLIIENENLYGIFNIDLEEAEDPNIWLHNVKERKVVNGFLRELAIETDPRIIDGSDSAKDLLKLYYYLDGNTEAITPEQEAKLKNTIQQIFGIRAEDFFAHPETLEIIIKEILRLYTNISAGNGDYNKQLDDLDYIADYVEIQVLDKDFLAKYKDAWLAGAGIALGGRDVLDPQYSLDKLGYFKWASVPTPKEVENEKIRIEGLRNNLTTNKQEFETKMITLSHLDKDSVEGSLEEILRLNPAQTETFVEIGNLLVSDPTTIPTLKTAFAVFYEDVPPSVDTAKLDAVIARNLAPNVVDILKKLKKSMESSGELMFIFVEGAFDNDLISPMNVFRNIQPYFETLYEYYEGNISSLYDDVVRFDNTDGNLDNYIINIDSKLHSSVDNLNILENDIKTKPEEVRANKNDYYTKLIRGQAFIEGNLIDGRDHMNYIRDLTAMLVDNGLLADPNIILALVPDLDTPPGGALTLNAIAEGTPLIEQLKGITEVILNEFITTQDADRKTILFTINQYLNSLGFSGKLIKPTTPPQIEIVYEPRVLLKYLNGIKVGRSQDAKNLLAKQPYGYAA